MKSRNKIIYTVMRVTKELMKSTAKKEELIKYEFYKHFEELIKEAEKKGIYPDNYRTIDITMKIVEVKR